MTQLQFQTSFAVVLILTVFIILILMDLRLFQII